MAYEMHYPFIGTIIVAVAIIGVIIFFGIKFLKRANP